MSEDRRTREQLLEELRLANEERAALARAIPPAQPMVLSGTKALELCVAALDQLRDHERDRSRRNSFMPDLSMSAEVFWVMHALCDRYGISRTEKVMVPCESRHTSDAEAHILDAIRGAI